MAGDAKMRRVLVSRAARNVWQEYQRQNRRIVQPPHYVPDPKRWPDRGLHAAWLGHSTVLLKVDGFTILTDPVFGERCGVNFGRMTIGLKRLVSPALDDPRQLPPIDLVLLSHAHLDHFDKPTLRRLEHGGTCVVTASQTSDLLRPRRYKRVTELGWGEETRVGPVKIRGIEVNHWGARMRTDTYRGYNGYLLETGRHRIVFGGDTALTDSFRNVRSSSKPVDLAIMPIGAYNPWIYVHCNPEQAWRMGNDCRAEFFLPVHHQTFRLGREPYFEPIERFVEAAGNDADRVTLTRIGQEWTLG